MRLSKAFLYCLAVLPVHTHVLSSTHADHTLCNGRSKSWLSRARDGVIESIWRVPSKQAPLDVNGKASARANVPTTFQARYGGDLVLRFDIKSEEEAKALAKAINTLLLDVWEFTNNWVDVRLSKDVLNSLLGLLPASLQRAHTPLMRDLADSIYRSYPSPAFVDPLTSAPEGNQTFGPGLRQSRDEKNIFFQDYQSLSVITPWLRLLKSLFASHVRMISIGTSYEGRDIPALRVGVHPTNSEKPLEPRKTIIVAGGSHAREWISTSTVNYVAWSFVTQYGSNPAIKKLLEKFDFIFIPTLNPDGYVYTWETDRLWRKNRQQTSLRFCKGLDLDRAYAFQWDSEASLSSNPCSESFSGESPFEAVEARRFANWVKNETENNNVEIAGYLDLHSYSQQVLYPYSYSCTSSPPNLEDLEELATGLAKAIRTTHGELYGITSACEGSVPLDRNAPVKQGDSKIQKARWPRMETGGGTSLDWMYHEMKVRHSFQLKLRDTGNYGFLLPSSNIEPTGQETFKAVKYFAEFLSGHRGIESGDEVPVSDEVKSSHPAEQDKADRGGWAFVKGLKDYEVDDDEGSVSSELRRRRKR